MYKADQAEPAIYYIKISGENTPAGNAELDAVTVFPGDVKAQPDAGDILTFTVANNVERVAFLPETMNHKATVEIEGKTYNSGETSDTAAVSVGENTFSLKVTSENGEKTKLYKIKVIRENAAVSADTITVYFSLTGDLLHGENGTHSPVNWIERQSVNIPKAATVKYITELMLNNRNIPFVSDGVYISSINGISEFDNGSRSGWMYRHTVK